MANWVDARNQFFLSSGFAGRLAAWRMTLVCVPNRDWGVYSSGDIFLFSCQAPSSSERPRPFLGFAACCQRRKKMDGSLILSC